MTDSGGGAPGRDGGDVVWTRFAGAPVAEASPPNGYSVEGELTAKHRKTTISVRSISVRSMRESLRESVCEGVAFSWVRH